MYRSIRKPPIPPPAQTPGHLIFLKKFGHIPGYVASLDRQMPHPLELQRGSNRFFKCRYSVLNNWLLFGLTIDQNRKAVVVLRHTFTYEKKIIQRIIYVNKDDRQKREKL